MLRDTIVSGMWGNDTQFVGNIGVLGEKGVVVGVQSKWVLCILDTRVYGCPHVGLTIEGIVYYVCRGGRG